MCETTVDVLGGELRAAHVPVDLEAFARERIPLATVERVSITVLVDNVRDGLADDTDVAHRPFEGNWPRLSTGIALDGCVPDEPLAEHGFSALVEVERAGGQVHRLLFDAGVTPDGMVENMRRLDIDPQDIEVIVCSHGHSDHTTGLDGLARRLGPTNLPVVIHPEFWTRRRVVIPGRGAFEMPTTSRGALVDAGFEIVERQQPSFLFEDAVLVTGEVARTTDFERGMPMQEAERDGHWEPDPLILDDQAIILDVRGKGLVVLTGCGHAGIVNITRYARQLTGVADVYAVLGGFHLGGAAMEPLVAPTIAGLADLRPDVVVPAHCTGWNAMSALAKRMPDAFIQNTVGTRYELLAA